MLARKFNRSIIFAASIFLFATAASGDVGKHPEPGLTTLKNFVRGATAAGEELGLIYHMDFPNLKAVVEYTGETRTIKEEKSKQLQSILLNHTERLGDLYKLDFSNEVGVREQGREYWLPIPRLQLPTFTAGVQKGQKFETNLKSLGSSFKYGNLFVMLKFNATVEAELPRYEPLLLELAEVKIGDSMAKTLKKLTRRYGEPYTSAITNYRQSYGFIIEPRYKTRLYVSDAGEGFRDKVYAILIVGQLPNPELELYKGLHLGDPLSKIREVMGEYTEHPVNEAGNIPLDFGNPRCLLKLRNGALFSFMITDDPYYFME
jgi:hypothetical protein